jgi:hypothetical protein
MTLRRPRTSPTLPTSSPCTTARRYELPALLRRLWLALSRAPPLQLSLLRSKTDSKQKHWVCSDYKARLAAYEQQVRPPAVTCRHVS